MAKTQLTSLCGVHTEFKDILAFVVAVRDPGVRPERDRSRGRPGALRSDV